MFQPDFKCHKTQLSRIKNFFNLSELGTELKLDCLCGRKNVRFLLFCRKLKFTVKIASYISSVHLSFISLQDKFSTATKVNTGALCSWSFSDLFPRLHHFWTNKQKELSLPQKIRNENATTKNAVKKSVKKSVKNAVKKYQLKITNGEK